MLSVVAAAKNKAEGNPAALPKAAPKASSKVFAKNLQAFLDGLREAEDELLAVRQPTRDDDEADVMGHANGEAVEA